MLEIHVDGVITQRRDPLSILSPKSLVFIIGVSIIRREYEFFELDNTRFENYFALVIVVPRYLNFGTCSNDSLPVLKTSLEKLHFAYAFRCIRIYS
jgi:hypothetical protein